MPSQTVAVVSTRSTRTSTAILRIDAALLVRHRVAMEAGGDPLLGRGPGSMSPAICSMVNWSNGMSRLSASITQSRYFQIGAGRLFVPVGVGVTCKIEPRPRPPFAVMRRGEQAVDDLLVRIGRRVARNASTSASVGGRPVRSSVTRRSSATSPPQRTATGFRARAAPARSGRSDYGPNRASRQRAAPDASASTYGPVSGSASPVLAAADAGIPDMRRTLIIDARSRANVASGSGSRSCGILSSPPMPSPDGSRRLTSLLPGVIGDPERPPLRMASGVCSRRRPRALVGP